MQKTKEPQYSICLEVKEKHGTTSLGLMSNQVWYDDPKRMAFVLSRYKFVAKILLNYIIIDALDVFNAINERGVVETSKRTVAAILAVPGPRP